MQRPFMMTRDEKRPLDLYVIFVDSRLATAGLEESARIRQATEQDATAVAAVEA